MYHQPIPRLRFVQRLNYFFVCVYIGLTWWIFLNKTERHSVLNRDPHLIFAPALPKLIHSCPGIKFSLLHIFSTLSVNRVSSRNYVLLICCCKCYGAAWIMFGRNIFFLLLLNEGSTMGFPHRLVATRGWEREQIKYVDGEYFGGYVRYQYYVIWQIFIKTYGD